MNKKYIALIIVVPFLAAVGLVLIPPYLEWEYKAESLTDEKMQESFYKVRDSCLTPDWIDPTDSLRNSYNSTHIINDDTCNWNKMTETDLRFYQIFTCQDYLPSSPHKDAIWNGDKCWWYLEDPKIPFEHLTFEYGFSWGDDPLGNLEEWCEDNNGLWFPKNTSCKYLTDEAGEKAKADLDDRRNPPVGGKIALAICQTVDIPCPEDPEFEGHYKLYSGRTYIHQYKSGEHYTFYFDQIDKELFYKLCIEKNTECTEYKKIRDDDSSIEIALLDYSIEITILDVETNKINTSLHSTGLGEIQVIDPDMNLEPEAVDNFDVDVWSDTDTTGISLRVTETDEATGIFEGTVFFTTTDESSGARLLVSHGDTIYAKYKEKTAQSEITFPLFINP